MTHGLDVITALEPICYHLDTRAIDEHVSRKSVKQAELAAKYEAMRAANVIVDDAVAEEARLEAIYEEENTAFTEFYRRYNPSHFLEADAICHTGFSAQAVKAVLDANNVDCTDDIVDTPADETRETWGMRHTSLIPFLVNAIKELSAANTALAARVTALEQP